MPQETVELIPPQAVEMQEFLFASQLSRTADRLSRRPSVAGHADKWQEELTGQIRESFRLQRWFLFAWLLSNGVQIPVGLVADQMHPPVGEQLPDQPRA